MKEDTDENKLRKDVKVTPSILDAFDLLKAPKDDSKLLGGAKILSQLQGSENEKNIQYVLKRLVRSLGANVPEVRAGYFATLVAMLKKFDQLTTSQLLELTKKELHANGSSKSEVGDVAFGQILICGAIFRSSLILKSSSEEQAEIVKMLILASKKKSYLSTIAYLILLDFTVKLDEDQFVAIVWSHIKEELKKDFKDHSLDSLYFLMIVNDKFPAKVKLRKLIGVAEVLSDDTIHAICEKLLTGVEYNSLNHPIYKEIGTRIANSPHLKLFWTSGIDSQLLKHNRNRELVAVNILTFILNNLQDNFEVLPELISRNFFKLFMDWFKGLQTASKIRSKRDNEDDNKIMIKKQKDLLNALTKALKSDKVDNKTRVEVLKKLLFNPGEINFAQITGSSVVKSIVADLDKEGVKKMAKPLKGVLLNTTKKFIKEDVERNWYNNERVKAAELLSYLVSHEAVKDDIQFKLTYMKMLMCFGFFKISDDESVTVSGDMSGAIKSSFYRCFTSRFSNVDHLVTVLSSLSSFICTIMEKDQVRAKLEKQFPEENMVCWQMLVEVCQKIEKNEPKSKIDKVFLILLYQLGLFLFSEPTHVKIARSSIKELKSCYDHYKKGKKQKQKPAKEGDLTVEPEWIEVLVEVLLSILSVESSVLRSVVQCVFRLLWEYLTPTSMGQIVSILDPQNESNPLTQDSESEGEESDEENNDDENDSVEEDDKNNESDNASDSNMEDDDDEEEMKIPEQLRLAVQKALSGPGNVSDTESIDADMIDKEEGKKIDDALAEAFRQFHQGKGKKTKKDRKDKKALSDFRIRVLDLIDIYLEKDPSMDICLGLMTPLTRCLEFCIQDSQFSELENRVRKTIKNLSKIKKFSSTDDVNMEVLCDYLKSTIDKGERSHFLYQALGDIITYFAIFIIHCSQKITIKKSPKKKHSSPLVKIFVEALQGYFTNRNCLLPIIFFHNVLQTEWDGTYELIPIVIENIFNNETRQFRRNEGVELISGFYRALKRIKPASDNELSRLSNLEAQFEKTLTDTLSEGKEIAVKNNFFNLLKKLIDSIKKFHENSQVKSDLCFESLIRITSSCKGTVKAINNNHVQSTQANEKKQNKKKRKIKHTSNGHAEPQEKKNKRSLEQSV